MKQTIVSCEVCKEQPGTRKMPPVTFDGETLDICSSACFSRWIMGKYHDAMSQNAGINIRMKRHFGNVVGLTKERKQQ